MQPTGGRHERALLDALDAKTAEAFAGPAWRVTPAGRDPLRGSAAGGRWSPAGAFDVLYTSLAAAGALAEIGYRLSLEPVWPSRVRHALHRFAITTKRTLRLPDLTTLGPLGVEVARYGSFDYAATKSIAAAAHFLEFDSLIVPSARALALNLVLFTASDDIALRLEETAAVDWAAWRAQQPAAPRRRPPSPA